MAIDREQIVQRAEKLLRQGRLEGAIAEYEKLVEDQPGDWAARNALGDLYVRAGSIDRAGAEFAGIGDHYAQEGFFPRAIAVYKKILKIKPRDEDTLLKCAEAGAHQGLLADAKAWFGSVAEDRRKRGDRAGANQVLIRVADVDPSDLAARLNAARACAENGDLPASAKRYKELATELFTRSRTREGMEALEEAVRLDPSDGTTRDWLVRCCIEQGEMDAARVYATSGAQLVAVAESMITAGNDKKAVEVLRDAIARQPSDVDLRDRVVRMFIARGDLKAAAECLPQDPDEAFNSFSGAVDSAIAVQDWKAAADTIFQFLALVPGHLGALSKLVEVAIDGDLSETLSAAQSGLVDCYISAGRGAEARLVAEDLAGRDRDEASIARLRRALELVGEPEPQEVIENCLAGRHGLELEPADVEPSTPQGSVEDALEQEVEAAIEEAPPEATEDPGTLTLAIEHAIDLGIEIEAPREEKAPRGVPGTVSPPADAELQVVPTAYEAVIESESAPAETSGEAGTEAKEDDSSGFVEIDLSDALAELKANGPDLPARNGAARPGDIEDTFKQMRDEAISGAEASAREAYESAVAQRDHGNGAAAIESLQKAVRVPRYRFAACAMIARIHREEGRTHEAIEWMERAAQASATTPAAARDLLYELGQALEETHELSRALAVYLELQAEAGEYRDVSARIAELSLNDRGV